VHRWSILIIVERDATQSSLLSCKFTLHVSCVNHTHHQEYTITVTTAFDTVQLPSSDVATLATEGGSCTVPEAVFTVLCTPDDGCGWHTKHVEWTYRIINRLLCVASRTFINTGSSYVWKTELFCLLCNLVGKYKKKTKIIFQVVF
jgi:hypothetical protein